MEGVVTGMLQLSRLSLVAENTCLSIHTTTSLSWAGSGKSASVSGQSSFRPVDRFFLELSRLSLTSGKEYLPVYCHCYSTEPLHWSIL